MRSRWLATVAAVTLGLGSIVVPHAAAADSPLPRLTPTPRHVQLLGGAQRVPGRVVLAAGRSVDRPTIDVLSTALRHAGAERIELVRGKPRARSAGMTVVVGSAKDTGIAAAAGESGVTERSAQGYGLFSAHGTVLLAGADSDGTFYAAQTFRQLLAGHSAPSVAITDRPSIPRRGTIEGFYGAPWSHADRVDQLRFYGRMKLNTYVYTPKDDPYLRERWRQEYPKDRLAELGKLVRAAKDNHVRFTYAVSPGLSICYSDNKDVAALKRKLESVYRLGVRSFSVPFDDISYDKWNCSGDEQRYGKPSSKAAGKAQAELLNTMQHEFVDKHDDLRALETVPTEYSDTEDSPYKRVIRNQLDPSVLVMWTGEGVIPTGITRKQARRANKVWGRKVYLWDNYPVNDYDDTAGRLLLAPYEKREPGMSAELSGLVLNPMNQSHASKVALYGGAAYAWNDTGYDPQRAWRAAAEHFSGGDRATTRALLALFDTQHLAPSSTKPWQPQAPVLRAKLRAFEKAFTGSAARKHAAIERLRGYQRLLAGASERIRANVHERGFLEEARPWLDALALWGKAFGHTLDGIEAEVDGDGAAAGKQFDTAASLAGKASAIRTIPGTTRPQGPVKVADGVLDKFIEHAPGK